MRLQDMDLKVGDVVAITLPSGEVVQHTIDNIADDGTHYSKETGGNLGNAFPWRIIRRASTTAHIITHEGREYDLTALETPPFFLPDEVYEALVAWPHGWVHLMGSPWENKINKPSRTFGVVVRAKPAPVEDRIECYRGVIGDHRPQERGTCIKRADGSIDWTTWEPEE